MVIVFDVNGTLLDTGALAPQMRKVFGAKYSVREWLTEVIQYAMATTMTGDYREFGEIGMAVLEMAAAARKVRLSRTAVEGIRKGMNKLPAFPDVKSSLRKFRKSNFRLATLSNSAAPALEKLLRNAGLSEFFEQVLSIGSVERYKPALETYRAAARSLGVETDEMLMVAAHPWDLMGASRAGCRTAFLARPGKSLFPGTVKPDYIAHDLTDLEHQLAVERRPASSSRRSPSGRTMTGLIVAAAAGSMLVRRISPGGSAPRHARPHANL